MEFQGKYCRITVHGTKNKPNLMFIHGYPDNPDEWVKQMPYFQEEYQILLVHLPFCTPNPKDCHYDMPFLGFEFHQIADDINTLIEKNVAGKVNLVGHDWGSLFSSLMVARNQELFNTVTLVDVSPGRLNGIFGMIVSILLGLFYQYLLCFIYLTNRFLSHSIAIFLQSNFKYISPSGWIVSLSGLQPKPIPEPKHNPLFTWFYIRFQFDLLGGLFKHAAWTEFYDAKVRVPTHFIYGTGMFNDKNFLANLKKNQYQSIKIGTDHWPMFTYPDEFNQSLGSFLKKYNE